MAACAPGQTGECEEHVDLASGAYGNNLVELYRRFEPVAKQFVWVSTTPVPNVTTSMGRTYEIAVAYNKQALDFLSTYVSGSACNAPRHSRARAPARSRALTPLRRRTADLVVDDLWAAFIASCGAYYKSCPLQLPANVHLTKVRAVRSRVFFRSARRALTAPAPVQAGETFAAQHAFASIQAAIARLEARGE